MDLNDEQLKSIKNIEIEMLRCFIEICEELSLRYFLIGGTLLGAVRHNGFIPWDDDIDVGMLREDYEIFIKKAQELIPKNYFLQTYKTDPGYPNNFAKIRNSETTFIETSVKNIKMNHGVYIDIFPLDYYPEKNSLFFKIKNKLMTVRIGCVFNTGKTRVRTKIIRLVSRIFYPSAYKTVEKREKLYKSITISGKIANHCGAWGKKEIVPQEWYGDGIELVFEGMKVNAPCDYDKWLTQVYGDYKVLPPEEKRITHHFAEVIDLEKSYKHYVE